MSPDYALVVSELIHVMLWGGSLLAWLTTRPQRRVAAKRW